MPINSSSWADHLKRSNAYSKMVERLYHDAIKEAIRLGLSVNADEKKPFSFDSYPILKERVNKLFRDLSASIEKIIVTGTKSEWMHANASNDALVKKVIGNLDLPKEVIEKYNARNLDALFDFQSRKINGLKLSERIWKLTTQFKGELELALDVGIGEGKSANALSLDVRQYLEQPDKLFRRVRDKRGVLQLSKAAKNYHPGAGVYRSSYKNAHRLTRTEQSMAYRTADHTRAQQLDFIVGFEVRRSNNPYPCPLCDSFTGLYPKAYRFISNHPQCRCYSVKILASNEEIDAHFERLMDGKDSELTSANTIRRMPKSFMDYVKDNEKRILRASTPPYWVRDNFKNGVLTGGLNF